jgi:hypothetical protein
MSETEQYIVKTGRVRHGDKLYAPGESIELGKEDAEKLASLDIIEREGPGGLGTELLDAETEKKLYVRATLEFGPRHPAHGAPVLLDKKTAARLEDLGIVSFCPAEEAEGGEPPQPDCRLAESLAAAAAQAPEPKIAKPDAAPQKIEAAPQAVDLKIVKPDAAVQKPEAGSPADKPGK